MDIRFADKNLEALYTAEKGAQRYPSEVVDAFFDLVALISESRDERDLRALKGARLEKLVNQQGCYSMRLNRQWRLELQFEARADEKVVVILRISKHYGD